MIHYIFDKPIKVKTFDCTGGYLDPKVNIFVRVTDKCNSNCKFCSNKSSTSISSKVFNVDKLLDIIDEINRNEISVGKINITGGEPSLYYDEVMNIVTSISRKYPDIHLHLNTNGILDESRRLMKNDIWNSISMSLHHYSIPKIMEIYGIEYLPDNYLNFNGINLSKVNLSCNLIKGYIDSYPEILNYCKFAYNMNIKRVGFVGLMPINQYSKDNNIRYHHLPIPKISDLLKWTGSLCRNRVCNCRNYMYNDTLEVYFREVLDPTYSESSLVYDGQNLYQGFSSSEVIV